MKIVRAKNYADMSRKAANIISAQVIMVPDCVLGLATGSTPIGIYAQLVDWYNKGDIDFAQTVTVNLDEYCGLDQSHPQSYRHFMDEHLFRQINIDPKNIHIPDGKAADTAAECRRYDELIESVGGLDLQLLGIGHNGHIGFNEPADAFSENTNCVTLGQSTIAANARFFTDPSEVPRQAITMGIKAIMQSRKLLLVVNGADKKDILQKVLFGPITPQVPGSIIQLHPDLTVIAADAL